MSSVEKIIDCFGGLTGLARARGIAVSTVQGWKERGRIPQEHWLPIVEAAKTDGIELSLLDFLPGEPSQDSQAASPEAAE